MFIISNALITVDKDNIDIRYYSIIYNLLDDIKLVMSGMLSPIIPLVKTTSLFRNNWYEFSHCFLIVQDLKKVIV